MQEKDTLREKPLRGRTRRQFLGQTALAALSGFVPKQMYAKGKAGLSRRPNVLFLISDDMRVELGCYGSRFRAQTPNLDALAASGVRFDRNYCQFPLCNPSRTSLLTGYRPTTTKVLGNGKQAKFREMHPEWKSLPQLFRESGYTTLGTGKVFHFDDPEAWTIADGIPPAAPGAARFERIVVPQEPVPPPPGGEPVPPPATSAKALHSDRMLVFQGDGEGESENIVADRAIAFLREHAAGGEKQQPFFLGCGFSKPHSPPTAPQRFYDLYDPNAIQLTPDFAAWPTVPPGFPPAAIRKRNADLFISRGASKREAKEVICAYLASISWADWNLGRVVNELDALGLRKNTIVVFVADHGYQLGEKGKWSKAGSLFEMGTRVPLIISAPGEHGNSHTSYQLVESLDIYPTLVQLCGLTAPRDIHGKSLVPLLRNPKATWNRPAYSVWSEDGVTLHGVAVRKGKWRYAEFGKNGVNGAMLFDEESDPDEMTNLADDPQHAQVRAELSPLVRNYAAALQMPA